MTLLELLVKELPGRGGWPMAANIAIKFETYEFVIFYNTTEKSRIAIKSFVNLGQTNNEEQVAREQYEAAIAAQHPAWNGEGLPPVGCKCEYVGNDTSWGIVKVIGYDEDRVVFKPSGEDYYGITPGDKALFRPIRTEADRKRESAIQAMYEVVSKSGYDTPEPSSIYDAIAAGKIPGVEISK
jgi:hypothetical protein